MAKKDPRPDEFRIKELELEVQDRERELIKFREEVGQINIQLEKFISQIGDQIRLANLIQKTLVPTDIPTIPGFEFSTKFVASPRLGGDYFDVFELEDKMQFGILMANSSGPAMASLFLSVLLKLTTQIEARKGQDPAQVLKKMSEEIQTKVKEAQSTNAFYALIDRRDLGMSYSMSGKILGYVYKNETDKFIRLEPTQGILGEKSAKMTFKKESLTLDPRDRVIIVSQGLLKLQNKKGENFTEDRLVNILADNSTASCHEMRNEIHFQAKRFHHSDDYPQDLSVIIMKVKDKVLKLKK